MDAVYTLLIEFWGLARWLIPFAALAGIAIFLELRFPRRHGSPSGLRWITSIALASSAWALISLLAPVTAALSAIVSADAGYGLLNLAPLSRAFAVALGFLAYDAFIYGFHRILHEVPGLWRLHRVHHTDRQIDASTTLRVHPLEPVLASLLGIPVVAVIGIPPEAIFLHFLALAVLNFWHHANIASLPGQRHLALFLNIPELHEVHHSLDPRHHNANYGSILSIWDRLFGTLIDDPELGDGRLEYGLDEREWDHPETVGSLLIDPVRK